MSEIDDLMSRDPLNLTNQDLDKLIEYHREQRRRRASGERPRKPSEPTADISQIAKAIIQQSKPATNLRRRI